MRLLVTGGAGYIGSVVTAQLLDAGHQVIQAARRVTGRPVQAVDGPRRPGDPAVLVASSARIGLELDWAPRKPALDEMIGDAWAWLQAAQPAR